jgi:hypothetical protein
MLVFCDSDAISASIAAPDGTDAIGSGVLK